MDGHTLQGFSQIASRDVVNSDEFKARIVGTEAFFEDCDFGCPCGSGRWMALACVMGNRRIVYVPANCVAVL
jgi:hypothetical protein